ncbi:PhzF family phenazine biosynthesis protein [Fibrella forsythiae]|uniref:PhzF family phenazine biosynthesis protein n=1 Tax=Fibrella forsythiae TaxID=2817061 RepID=A0ABS3JC91_9BACT|nr:PhzF family phenazine biosynthesis protein [Fibrella forsythiae]MBO0947071.1 PhzF family phenazine biosynthesis protein [Fibrella forsythiae]
MKRIPFYIVDVFASNKYEGNQLAVFLDLSNEVSDEQMQHIAREINFAETTFVKANRNNQAFVVRIFTPEHEVPFAGHPSIGTSYIIARFLLPNVPESLILTLTHSDITIRIVEPDALDQSLLFMRQAQPEFREYIPHQEIAQELGIPFDQLDVSLPVQEISTGLPYIIIPLIHKEAMDTLTLPYNRFRDFLYKRKKYRTNSNTGHSTSLFFFTTETYEPASMYNTRMLLLENGRLSEDAATGSANGCLLAYLLAHRTNAVDALVEQGFQMNRKSYIYLNGSRTADTYELNVGGHTQLVAEGHWYV